MLKETSPSRISHFRTAVLLAILLVSAVPFLARGVYRGCTGIAFDLTGPVAQSLTWIEGGDPYSPEETRAVMAEYTGNPEANPTAPLYPPSALPFFVPFAMVSWNAAVIMFTLLTSALYILSIAACASWVRAGESGARRGIILILVFAVGLLWAPAQTGLHVSNPGIFSGPLAVIGLALGFGRRQILGGILMGCAIAIKPQLALPLWFVFLPAMRIKPALIAVATVAVIAGAVSIQLNGVNPDWPSDLRDNLSLMPGLKVNEEASARFSRLHLNVLLHFVLTDPSMASKISIALLFIPGVIWTGLAFRQRGLASTRHAVLLAIPAATISLLITYHRSYDAVTLLPIGVWCVVSLLRPDTPAALRRLAVWLGVPLLAFLLAPWASIYEVVSKRGGSLGSFLNETWVEIVIGHHLTWILLYLTVVGICALCARSTAQAALSDQSSPH